MTARCLILCLMMAFSGLRAQNCADYQPILVYPGATPSFLNVITGYATQTSEAYWTDLATKTEVSNSKMAAKKALYLLHAGKNEEGFQLVRPYDLMMVPESPADSMNLRDNAPATEVAGLYHLIQGKPDFGEFQFDFAMSDAPFGMQCRLKSELLVAQYLVRFGNATPIHRGFNGGFYGFVQDSMGWKVGQPEPSSYLQALNTVVQLYRMDNAHPALYLELLGDLLSEEPNKFNANYLAGLAYLRAAMMVEGDAKQAFERKALFALEAPRDREDRFNQYRFTQLKKALQIDVDSAGALPAAAAQLGDGSPIKVGFSANDPGSLARILTKSKAQIEARAKEAKPYEGDVDLKVEVKKDSTFNTFALFLIGIIVGAAFFIFFRIKKAAKQKDR